MDEDSKQQRKTIVYIVKLIMTLNSPTHYAIEDWFFILFIGQTVNEEKKRKNNKYTCQYVWSKD